MENKIMPKLDTFRQTLREGMDVFMHRSMRGMGLFAKANGLSISQVSILMQMHYRGAYAVSKISEQYDISVAGASQLVDKLVHSGYVERVEDPHDRRAKLLNLTNKGRGLIQQGITERYRWMDQLADRLTSEERTQISDAFNILTRVAQDLETAPV
jgi:DNA-binding MarR family transcriptional regulator